ncbi:chromosomal replication initiator protein [Novosphingobium sp. PhB165]|uniref:helix-turn-helix domain-containing protein n=1 Tax=Novosphingobium sp. PhB165 TaxID=2485105 RepID=UPI001043D8B2|nr:helix-turn-helix domain-containing protein [Novosphingobium sp. PhB165]TCM17229.1 chromosomal replication initiator protein [Novosphingobium sp. PhB165]
MATALSRTYAPGAEWFGRSGFPDIVPSGANAYAKRLVQYISDPSTVRARTMDEYGKAPSLENIRRWRADWVNEIAERRAARAPVDDHHDDDNEVNGICTAIAERLVAASAAHVLPGGGVIAGTLSGAANDAEEHFEGDTREQAVTYMEVIQACAARCGETVEDLLGPSRSRSIVRARQFTATVLRSRGNSYPSVGRFMGNRDHSTIMHSVGVFFAVGMRDPFFVRAWMAEAPCATKMARTAAELDMLSVVRR